MGKFCDTQEFSCGARNSSIMPFPSNEIAYILTMFFGMIEGEICQRISTKQSENNNSESPPFSPKIEQTYT
jgi:hypothetical protein